MTPEQEWDETRGPIAELTQSAGIGVLRVTLLFGSAAVAFALLATPLLSRLSDPDRTMASNASGIDYTQTGSIGYNGSYTIRRSVLQGSAGSICVIRDNGTRSGDCY